MGEAADLAVAARGLLEVEVRERMRRRRARPHAHALEQRLAHQVRQLSLHRPHAEVHARLAEVDRPQLRVRVGHVQQRQVAERGDFVERVGSLCLARAGAQAGTRGRGEREEAKEFSSLHWCLRR